MKVWKIVFVIMAMAIVTGCASSGKYLSNRAITDPAHGISIIHPIELEKQGVKAITSFICLMDHGLWTEVVGVSGVWPILGQTPEGKIISSYVFLKDIDYWGDFLLQADFPYSRADLIGVKFLYLNRDGGWIYTLSGLEIIYDSKKFDDNKEYREEIFKKHGMTLLELDSFWIKYLKGKELELVKFSSVREVLVGSSEWERYKKELASRMRYNYVMGNKEIRCGFLPLEQFRLEATEIPGFTGSERFLKQVKVPLFALPFTGAGMLILAGANVLGDAVAAGVNDDWSGCYARAKVLRYEMAPLFRQICQIYKKLLVDKDKRIKKLESEIRFQQIMRD